MKKALLIYPMKQFCGRTPLGLCLVGTIFKKAGFDVKLLMKSNYNKIYTDDEIREKAIEYKPDIIGMTIFDGYCVRDVYKLSKKLKGIAKILMAGGPHTVFCSDEILKNSFNVSVRGEAEATLEEFLTVWDKKKEWNKIKGISYLDGNRIFHNENREYITDVNKIPFPDRSIVEKDTLGKNEKEHYNTYGNLCTSRGCPGMCVFCSRGIFGNCYRFRTAENIIEEIKHIHKKYGTVFFSFDDDSFTIHRPRMIKLMEMIEKLDFKITWWCQTRVTSIDRDLLKKMKKTGCIEISYGVESGDPEVLKMLKKGINLELAEKAIKMTKEEGIDVSANFMMGFPFENLHQLDNTLKFIKKIAPYVNIFSAAGIPVPHPGTDLYNKYHEEYGFTNWWIRPEFDKSKRAKRLYHQLAYVTDFAIESNFFHYNKQTRKKINEILDFMGNHNVKYGRIERDRSTIAKKYIIMMSKLSMKITNVSYTLDDALLFLHKKIIRPASKIAFNKELK